MQHNQSDNRNKVYFAANVWTWLNIWLCLSQLLLYIHVAATSTNIDLLNINTTTWNCVCTFMFLIPALPFVLITTTNKPTTKQRVIFCHFESHNQIKTRDLRSVAWWEFLSPLLRNHHLLGKSTCCDKLMFLKFYSRYVVSHCPTSFFNLWLSPLRYDGRQPNEKHRYLEQNYSFENYLWKHLRLYN